MYHDRRAVGGTLPGTDPLTDGAQHGAGARARLRSGDVLAHRYQVERALGTGGMGAVYAVFDRELEEPVALKLLHEELSSDPDFRHRLRQEVRLARRVSHPNVCRVHDLGQHAGQLFVTMELLRGPTLRQVMKEIAAGAREPLSLGRKIDLVVQLAAGLAAAHRVGIVHRDVKPDNVIVEDDRSVLTDFGVASPVELAASRRTVVGTPDYIAPEILRGEAASPAADVYACALVAYELLAGRPAFPAGGIARAMERAREGAPPPPLPEEAAPPLSREALGRVLARALDGRAEVRHESVQRLAEALALAARGAAAEEEAAPAARPAAPPPPLAAAAAAAAAPAPEEPVSATAVPRVATALALAFSAVRAAPEEEDVTAQDTRPISLGEGGDLDLLERVVTSLGGTVVSSGPGELMALFGAPRALGDDAVRAAQAGHALVERCEGGRVGLHTGRVDLSAGRGAPRAGGDAVDRARALAGAASAGQVIASGVTARHLFGRFDVTRLPGGDHRVEPGLLARAERYDLPPLYGRAGEVAQLERLILEALEERSPRAALVVAPAGAGKSRLRLEIERHLAGRREVDWLIGRASPLGGGVPLGLLRDASRDWYAAAEAAAGGGRAAALAAARGWLEARASVRPVVLAIDDVHWADRASRELLADLRRSLDQVPVALLLFARSDPDAPALDLEVDLELPLPPLGAEALRAIARRLAPDLPPAAVDHMVRRAGGNPFFLEELARHAGESTGPQGELPASVELVIQSRLDRLPRAARRLVHAAAVVGREFDRAVLTAALDAPMPASEVEGALAELERRQIIAPMLGAGSGATPSDPAAERYIFHHALIRDVAYAQIEPAARRRAHAAVARHLEERGAGRREPAQLVALALHLDAAGDRAGAREAYRAAGALALSLAAYRDAESALRRAEELSEAPDPALLELSADALLQLDSQAATERLERALALAQAPLDRARLLHKLGLAGNARSDHLAAIAHCEEGLSLLGPPEELAGAPPAVRLVAAHLLGTLGWVIGYEIGDHRRGLPHAERAVALLEDGDPRELAGALSRLAANYMRAGRWRDRLRCNQRHLEIAQALRDAEREIGAHINLGVNHHSLGRLDLALEHTRRALELAVRTGRATTRALAQSNLGLILLDAGEDERARAEVEEAIALAERIGYTRFLPEALGTLGRLAARAGRLEEAEGHTRAALERAREARSTVSEGEALRLLAGVAALRGRTAEAEELLARAHELLADDRYEQARTWAAEARVAALAGQGERARALRGRAARVFEDLGAALDAARLGDPADLR